MLAKQQLQVPAAASPTPLSSSSTTTQLPPMSLFSNAVLSNLSKILNPNPVSSSDSNKINSTANDILSALSGKPQAPLSIFPQAMLVPAPFLTATSTGTLAQQSAVQPQVFLINPATFQQPLLLSTGQVGG